MTTRELEQAHVEIERRQRWMHTCKRDWVDAQSKADEARVRYLQSVEALDEAKAVEVGSVKLREVA